MEREPSPDVVRRTEDIARRLRTDGSLPHEGPVVDELDQALDQLQADRTNGEALGAAYGRLCEAIAAARHVR